MISSAKLDFENSLTIELSNVGYELPKKMQQIHASDCDQNEILQLDKYYLEKAKEKICSWGKISPLNRTQKWETYRSKYLDEIFENTNLIDNNFIYEKELINGLNIFEFKKYKNIILLREIQENITKLKEKEVNYFNINELNFDGTKKSAYQHFTNMALQYGFVKGHNCTFEKKINTIKLIAEFDRGGNKNLNNKIPCYFSFVSDLKKDNVWHSASLDSIVDYFSAYSYFTNGNEFILGVNAYFLAHNLLLEKLNNCIVTTPSRS